MSGWSGGIANRTWQRTTRKDNATSGRIDVIADIQKILARFRSEHGWQPGMIWNPYQGKYVEEA